MFHQGHQGCALSRHAWCPERLDNTANVVYHLHQEESIDVPVTLYGSLFVFFYLVNFKQGWDVWLWRNKPPNRRPKQTPKQASETHPSRPHPGLGTPFWEYYLTSCACKHTPTHTCTYFVPTNPRWRYFRMGTGAAFGSFPGCAVWWLLWWRCCRRFGVLAEVVMSFFFLILIQILSALICWIDLCGGWFHQAGALFRQMKWRERVPKSWSCSCESQFLLNDWMVRWCCFGYLVS